MKNLIKAALTLPLVLALSGCIPTTPEEAKEKAEWWNNFYSRDIKANTYDVCIRGNSYLYYSAGNTSHTILLLDKDSKVIPCKEPEQ